MPTSVTQPRPAALTHIRRVLPGALAALAVSAVCVAVTWVAPAARAVRLKADFNSWDGREQKAKSL